MKQKVGIIIVNWNGKEDTLRCLESLGKIEYDHLDLEIIVVDNGSTDASVGAIQKKYPEVTLLPLETNLGFTGGNNKGMERALQDGCTFCWLLNNDTIVDPGALIGLVKAFSSASIGIAGSKIYFMKGREFHHDRYTESERGHVLWYAGGKIDWNNIYGSHRGVDEIDHGQYDQQQKTDFVTGCSLLISRNCLATIGMFDDRYFAYLEDMDLSQRANLSGFATVYAPASIVWHKNSGSTARPGNSFHQYYMTRNRLLFGMRFGSPRTKIALAREAFRIAITGTAGQKHAIIDAALGRWGKQLDWQQN